MKVLLRHKRSGLFYAGPDQWSGDPEAAMDFQRPDVALDRVSEGNMAGVELVMHFDDATFDFPVTIVSARGR
jgi:hypothetical protein